MRGGDIDEVRRTRVAMRKQYGDQRRLLRRQREEAEVEQLGVEQKERTVCRLDEQIENVREVRRVTHYT